uniref:RNase H type-1 domain-containing protein n=1 Tax=Strigamia maritima TaxID=126957 RepID=T1IHL8_STRMM
MGKDLDTCRSFGGYILYVGNSVVCWGCNKQSSVATSVMEAEYVTLVNAVREGYWIASIFQNICLCGYENFPDIYSDSLSSIQFMKTMSKMSKQNTLKLNTVCKEYFEKGYFHLKKIATDWNISDMFTKWLNATRLKDLCKAIFDLRTE